MSNVISWNDLIAFVDLSDYILDYLLLAGFVNDVHACVDWFTQSLFVHKPSATAIWI